MIRNRLAVAALLACAAALCAQAPAPAPVSSGTQVISGVVLNAKTGRPIPGASVTLRRTGNRASATETRTDQEGRFAFTQLPDGKFSLRASHRGYIASDFEEHPTGSTAIVTGQGLVSTGLRFTLDPQAVLFGLVTEDSGDPVPRATISLYRQDDRNGTQQMVRATQTNADELGNFEFPRLAPGTYVLSVSGKPWYSAQVSMVRSGSAGDSVSQRRAQLDVAYPITFYPDSTDPASAVPIAVAAGDRIPINFTLHPVQAIHIFLKPQTLDPNRGPAFPQLRQEAFGTEEFVQPNISMTSHLTGLDGNQVMEVEIGGIPPGQYEVEIPGQNGESGRTVDLDASSERVNLDFASSSPLADVSGKLTMAGGIDPPNGLALSLVAQQGDNRNWASMEPRGAFQVHSVRPGAYEVEVTAAGQPMTILRLTVDGAPVDSHLIRVGSDSMTLSATVAESTASIRGFARRNGKPASGVFLLMVPQDPALGRGAWRTNQSDSDGSFDFDHLIPGEYTLLAIEEGWTLNWADRDAIARYLPGGLKITIPPHSGEIVLKDSVEAQPK